MRNHANWNIKSKKGKNAKHTSKSPGTISNGLTYMLLEPPKKTKRDIGAAEIFEGLIDENFPKVMKEKNKRTVRKTK